MRLRNLTDLRKVAILLSPFLASAIVFTAYLAQNYYLKPFSDPLNWLRFAGNLGQTFRADVFPIVYPVWLRACCWLLGDLYVFFSNYPLLLGFSALSAAVAAEMLSERPLVTRWFASVLTACLVLGFDPWLQLALLNPYRDPLAHVFLMGSVLFFLRYARGRAKPLWHLSASGLLLGLAYATREPSILLLPFFFLAGLMASKGRPLRLTSRDVAVFTLFLLFGAGPFLVQTYLVSGQVLLPAKSAGAGGYLPGFRMDQFLVNASRALRYLCRGVRPWVMLGALFGAGVAWRRRQIDALLVLAAPAFVFGMLYLAYRVFVPRYFFVVPLFATPLAAYGLVHAGKHLPMRARAYVTDRRLRLLALVVPFVLGSHLAFLTHRDAGVPRLRLDAAREFRKAAWVTFERDALVFSERNLRGCVEWFGHLDAMPVWLLSSNKQANVELVVEHTARQLKKGRPVYVLDAPPSEKPGPTASVLRQGFDLVPCGEPFSTNDLKAVNWRTPFAPHLYTVRAWTGHVSVARVPLPHDRGCVLAVNALAGSGTLMADAQPFAQLTSPGTTYLWFPNEQAVSNINLRLQSPTPVPGMLDAWALRPDAPLTFSFDADSERHTRHVLSAAYARPYTKKDPYACVLSGSGTLKIPVPWPTPSEAVLTGAVTPVEAGPFRAQPFTLSAVNRADMESLCITPDQNEFSMCLPLQTNDLSIELSMDFGPSAMSAWHIGEMTLYPVSAGTYARISLGDEGDTKLLHSGFYGPESDGYGTTFRWSKDVAVMHFVLNRARDLTLMLHVLDLRPGDAGADTQVTVSWNGTAVPVTLEPRGKRMYLLKCGIPASAVKRGVNHACVRTKAWSPRNDSRVLGLALCAVSLTSQQGAPVP
jgi:hypothetical protein